MYRHPDGSRTIDWGRTSAVRSVSPITSQSTMFVDLHGFSPLSLNKWETARNRECRKFLHFPPNLRHWRLVKRAPTKTLSPHSLNRCLTRDLCRKPISIVENGERGGRKQDIKGCPSPPPLLFFFVVESLKEMEIVFVEPLWGTFFFGGR